VQEEQVALPAGTVISGRYVVKSLLGTDDSSATYLVEDQRTMSELFALKEVSLQSKGELFRFLLECQLLTRLDHPALVHVYALLKDDKHNRAYILMEHIKGPNLETLLQQQPEQRFSLPEAMNAMAPVIAALDYLHRQQPPIIHGNIKTTTIIVPKARGGARLVGLGAAWEYDSDATMAAVHSFPSSYRAPEQYSTDINVQKDIYGLGAVFYTLITGIVPTDAPSRLAQMDNEEIDPLKPVNEIVATVPERVAEVINRAMSLNARKNFSSVEQFWEALWAVESSSVAHSMPFVSSHAPLAPKQAGTRLVSVLKQPRASHTWKLWPLAPKQAVIRLATVSAPKQPGAPRASEPAGASQAAEDPTTVSLVKQLPTSPASKPALPKRPVEKTAPASGAKQPRAPRAWKLAVLLIVSVLLIGQGVSADSSSHVLTGSTNPTSKHRLPSPTPTVRSFTPTPTSTPPSTSVSVILHGTYKGTIYDIPAKVRTSLTLTQVQQSQGKISGILAVGPGLLGLGPFSGTIDTTKHLRFTVRDGAGNPTLFFEGDIQSATSLSGDYYRCIPIQGNPCHRTTVGYGIWNVLIPSSTSSTSIGTTPAKL
jgi:eukaryotic-like serine/threonine-protein kinase